MCFVGFLITFVGFVVWFVGFVGFLMCICFGLLLFGLIWFAVECESLTGLGEMMQAFLADLKCPNTFRSENTPVKRCQT